MKYLLAFSLFIIRVVVHAQSFEPIRNFSLPDSIQSVEIEMVDFDNDGLLDIALFGGGNNGTHIYFIKGDTVDVPVLSDEFILLEEFASYSITDYNGDNAMDIVSFGSISYAYLNLGNFTFNRQLITLPAFTKTLWVDLNNDGKQEVLGSLVSPTDTLLVAFENVGSAWQAVGDSLHIDVTSLSSLDADYDGNTDIVVSGYVTADSLYTGIVLNRRNFELIPLKGQEWAGTTFTGDINHDGIFDVLFSGVDGTTNTEITRMLVSRGGSHIVKDSVVQLTKASTFLADFNSDGRTDIHLLGKQANDTLNLIQTGFNEYDTLLSQDLLKQQFADIDRDGDLDVIQLTMPDSLHILVIQNNALENVGPTPPREGLGLWIFDRFFLYWQVSTDDHTERQSLTYDVLLEFAQQAEFDLTNERRLRVSHGNNLTQNFKLFENLTSLPSLFAIQAVDNSFFTFSGAGGLCMGSGTLNCAETNALALSVCRNEQVVLTSPPNALWFSFSEGFLGTLNSLSFKAEQADTLFYFDPSVMGCEALKAFTIEINNSPKTEFYIRHACINQQIDLGVEEGWESVRWSSQLRGNLGTQDSIKYIVTESDSILVNIKNNEGCDILRKTAIRISKPLVTVEEEQFVILKGQEVQLLASGAERYQWLPADWLTGSMVPNPIASPLVTTTYIVTGYDSLGCEAQTSVKISVEDTGFVPSLFTPNGDGKNDELKIYSLNTTASFTFSIYNREGKLVFETTNASDAVQRGWDGTKNGMKQPPGVYLWKVKGTMASGMPMLLNGKTEGSIVLVR